MISKKILWASVIGLALVGVAIGALAIRSARSDTVATPDTAANPAPANDQTNLTADPATVQKTSQPESPKTVSPATAGRRYGNRSVYYSYNEQPKRTFWQKHRDKLTVAAGAGTGALVGGLIGGKKGAGIGLLGGGAGSALYTYKLRHKHRRY